MSDKSYTLSGTKANLYGLLVAIPLLSFAALVYMLLWFDFKRGLLDGALPVIHRNMSFIQMMFDISNALLWTLLILILLVGVVLHELIHGIVMAVYAKNRWKSVSFGLNIRALAPFAHCKEALTPNAYRLCLVMPGIVLGDIPVIISWFTGNFFFLFFGIIFYLASACDLIVLWMSRNITDGMIQDHPEKIGFLHKEKEF